MAGIFISHSSRDRQAATAMAARLRAQGYASLFLDFDPADGIPAGRDWEREIYARLRGCDGVVVLCSADSMASDWCFAEIVHARALGKRLFPVQIGACSVRALLHDTQLVDLCADPEEGYARLWRGLRSAGLDPADSFAWESGRAPYPGLAPFQAADAAVYFGREAEQRQCLDTLAQMRRYGGDRLLVVVGASGSGKSSLVRAGVLPRVARMPDWRVLGPLRPQRRPDEELARVLSPPGVGDTAALVEPGAALASASEAAPERPAVLLVVDQLEELVTTSEPEAAARFVQALRGALAAQTVECYCLATLRADHLAALQAHPAWGGLSFRQLPLAAMGASHFAEIIRGPARVAGLELEEGLVEALAHDTGHPDALPLLAFTLNRLWRDFGDDQRITLDEYRARLGGLEGAIRREAEAVLAARAPAPETLLALRQAFRHLVRVEPEGAYTRRSARWDALPAAAHPLLEAFVAARLLVSGREQGGPEGSPRTLEVAHEALFRAWEQLRRWLDEDRVFLLWRQHALPAAEAWQRTPDDAGLLLSGGPLAEARRWRAERADELGKTLFAYIDASAAAGARLRRRRLGARAGLAVLVLAAAALGGGLWQQQRTLVLQRIDSYWSGALAARDAGGDAVRAAHYLARAADLGGAGTARDNALIAIGLLAGGVELAGEIALPGPGEGVRLSGDGRLLLAWRGREAWIHALADGSLRARFEHPDTVVEAQFTAAGGGVSRDAGGGLWLWDGKDAPRPLAQGGVAQMVVDRAGRRVAASGDDGVRVWALPGGEPGAHILAGNAIEGIAFLGEGSEGGVLAWSASGRFWRVDGTGATLSWDSGCAPRGVVLAAAADAAVSFCDTTLLRHALRPGRVEARWHSPERVDGVRFDGAADLAVSWSAGRGRLRVWQASDGAPRLERPLDGEGSLARVELLPGAERLLTAGADGWLMLWDLALGAPAATARHHRTEAPVLAVADAGGERVLAWSRAAGARLWDAGTLTPLSLPLRHPGRVLGAAMDGGGTILSWADDGSVRWWRRQPALELTAAVPTAAATSDLPRPQAPDAALKARLDGLGLHDYQVLHTQGEARLIAAGPLARRLDGGGGLSPPLTLDEGVRGGALLAGDRVVLWGNSSARLWDAGSGRPLSAVLRSDALVPERGRVDDGLLVSDGLRARQWHWPLPAAGTARVADWLALANASAMDEQGAIRVLGYAEWCQRMHAAQRPAAGCPPP